eukprot:RCo028280
MEGHSPSLLYLVCFLFFVRWTFHSTIRIPFSSPPPALPSAPCPYYLPSSLVFSRVSGAELMFFPPTGRGFRQFPFSSVIPSPAEVSPVMCAACFCFILMHPTSKSRALTLLVLFRHPLSCKGFSRLVRCAFLFVSFSCTHSRGRGF